jgi:hypothetical protein
MLQNDDRLAGKQTPGLEAAALCRNQARRQVIYKVEPAIFTDVFVAALGNRTQPATRLFATHREVST